MKDTRGKRADSSRSVNGKISRLRRRCVRSARRSGAVAFARPALAGLGRATAHALPLCVVLIAGVCTASSVRRRDRSGRQSCGLMWLFPCRLNTGARETGRRWASWPCRRTLRRLLAWPTQPSVTVCLLLDRCTVACPHTACAAMRLAAPRRRQRRPGGRCGLDSQGSPAVCKAGCGRKAAPGPASAGVSTSVVSVSEW